MKCVKKKEQNDELDYWIKEELDGVERSATHTVQFQCLFLKRITSNVPRMQNGVVLAKTFQAGLLVRFPDSQQTQLEIFVWICNRYYRFTCNI